MKIRIAVVVDGGGNWNACGFGSATKKQEDIKLMSLALEGVVEDGEARYWIEADVDPPKAHEILTSATKEENHV